ncbi:hypothetical protein QMZ92_11495 [Streptomyces sp. HNM0645]|uniref:hypothetical protein n=1 Tax=Streptomyces sp. HNM0645 TaxID=2782343 RepID=UPI0024B72F19|nr:hypothetical protein [Streptomyces sp. HNM0645]MDI9884999.1 hypothetical protein [Streptomyces sp. HNM0645]
MLRRDEELRPEARGSAAGLVVVVLMLWGAVVGVVEVEAGRDGRDGGAVDLVVRGVTEGREAEGCRQQQGADDSGE